MGIPWPPDEFGDDCPACFAPDETPKYVWITFSDIEISADHGPGDPPPPNGTWRLEQNAIFPCRWRVLANPWFFFFSPNGELNFMSISYLGIPRFIGVRDGPCQYSAPNVFQNPLNNIFYGGNGQVAFTEPSPSPSMGDTADEFGFTRDHDLKFDFWPVNPDYTTRIVSRKIPSNIRIKKSN